MASAYKIRNKAWVNLQRMEARSETKPAYTSFNAQTGRVCREPGSPEATDRARRQEQGKSFDRYMDRQAQVMVHRDDCLCLREEPALHHTE
jgi:hypothetical protein